ARTYLVRGRIHNSGLPPLRMTLGRADLYSLTEARQWARDILRQLSEGHDPRQARQQQVEAQQRVAQRTVAAVAQAWLDDHVSKLRSYRQTERYVQRFIVEPFGSRQIDHVHSDDVVALLRK